MLGTAIEFGKVAFFLGAIVAFAGWSAKARLEESFLRARFGEAYALYQRQVGMLIPFIV
jgi:protein-S-isoprenylcysteine O-methyltransferase Ste14